MGSAQERRRRCASLAGAGLLLLFSLSSGVPGVRASPATRLNPGEDKGLQAEGTRRLAGSAAAAAPAGYSSAVEVAALQAFKKSLRDPLNLLKSWSGSNPCSYYGVFCETVTSVFLGTRMRVGLPPWQLVVTGLDLNGFGLAGTISPQITALKYLGYIHLSHNFFTGTLPNLAPLQFLGELDVSVNKLSGPFPASVLSLKKLKYLDLRYNAFSGPIPPQLFQLNLDVLAINNNQLTASAALWQALPQAKVSLLIAANNPLGGALPSNLAPLGTTLEEILLTNTSITGAIPASIGTLKAARVINLSNNSLTGAVPATAAALASLVEIDLANNQLFQNIDGIQPLLALPNIQTVTISFNYFIGIDGAKFRSSKKLVAVQNCVAGLPRQRDVRTCMKVLRRLYH